MFLTQVSHINTPTMKYKIIKFCILLFIFLLISCNKESGEPIIFNPTDHIIRTLGAEMRFVVDVPGNGFYNFSSKDSTLNCEGTLCKDFLVPLSEMVETAQNLSDTSIFQWEVMTADSPYPKDQCVLLIYGGTNLSTGGYNDFMCSIGKDGHAGDIIRELSKSFTGDAKAAFDEIISFLRQS